jgi:putative transposase
VIIRKGYVFRLKSDAEKESRTRQTGGTCRFVWNKSLAIQNERMDRHEGVQSYDAMCKMLVTWKNDPEMAFLKEAHSQVLQQKLKDLRRAFDDFFDPKQPMKKHPVFKRKVDARDSFRYPHGFKIENRRIFLPKIGWVGFYKSREIEGTPKNVTVRQYAGHWYISVQCEIEVPDPVSRVSYDQLIGGDLGVSRFLTLSDGTLYEPLNSFRKMERKLAIAQRRLARMVKKSANWKKQKVRIVRLYARIANARHDYLHKVSTTLAKNHGVVVLEDLTIKNMTASAAGTIGNPGKNVKQKSGLNKSILDQGWGMFCNMVEYKLTWGGGRLVYVNPRNTSKTCSVCGHIMSKMPLSCRRWQCPVCGAWHDRDINAALNVKAAGQAVLACESNPIAGRKQEPPGMAALCAA